MRDAYLTGSRASRARERMSLRLISAGTIESLHPDGMNSSVPIPLQTERRARKVGAGDGRSAGSSAPHARALAKRRLGERGEFKPVIGVDASRVRRGWCSSVARPAAPRAFGDVGRSRLRVFLGLIGLICVMLSSCAAFRPEPINLRVSAQRFEARTLHSRRLDAYLAAMGVPSRDRWGFRRLSYVAVFERPDLKIVGADYRVALGKLKIAEQIPNPTVGVSAGFNVTQPLPTPWSVGPILSFLIQNFLNRDALIGAARQNILAARAAIDSVAWDERMRVYDALLALRSDRLTGNLYRQQAAVDRRIAQAVLERYQVGVASANAVTVVNLAAERSAFRQHQAKLAESLAKVGLASAIGLPSTALQGVKISFAIFHELQVPVELATDEQIAVVDRPAVRRALSAYDAAQYRLRAAVYGLVKGVKVSPTYGMSQDTYQYALGLHIHAPIFNQHAGQIAVARAERRKAAAHLESVQQRVFSQIENAVVDWRESAIALNASRQALRSAEHELSASREAYQVGAIGDVRFLGVRLLVLSARIQFVKAEQEHYRASGNLMAALHSKLWTRRNDIS